MVAAVAGNFVVTLVTLAVAGGAAWLAYSWIRKNPEPFARTLKKLGAQIPKAGEDPMLTGDPDPASLPHLPRVDAPRPEPIVLPTGPSASPFADPSAGKAFGTDGVVLVAADGSRLSLTEGEHEVGREFGLAVSLPSETSVSRRHAKLRVQGATLTVEDLGSTNGTWVGGARVAGTTTLSPGDAVRFGGAEFRVA